MLAPGGGEPVPNQGWAPPFLTDRLCDHWWRGGGQGRDAEGQRSLRRSTGPLGSPSSPSQAAPAQDGSGPCDFLPVLMAPRGPCSCHWCRWPLLSLCSGDRPGPAGLDPNSRTDLGLEPPRQSGGAGPSAVGVGGGAGVEWRAKSTVSWDPRPSCKTNGLMTLGRSCKSSYREEGGQLSAAWASA